MNIGYMKNNFSKNENKSIDLIIECNLDLKKEKLIGEFCNLKYKLAFINTYVVEIFPKDIPKLQCIEGIKNIHLDTRIYSQVNNSRRIISADTYQLQNLTGNGVGVAILDTGISPMEDFTRPYNRLLAFKDFVNDNSYPYDNNGHGTHVTGIACGNGYLSKGVYAGIAQKSNIISVKILDRFGQGNSSQALAGIQWIIDNKDKYNIRVANLSIGTNDRTINIPLVRAVNAAWDKGIVVIAAAGNQASRSGAISTPNVSRKIITVGSYNNPNQKNQNYFRSPFYTDYSNYSDVLAPGTDIVSCLSPNYLFNSKGRDELNIVEKNYIKMSGTSMATPMVSGAVALLIEKYPQITPAEIKRRIYKTMTITQNNMKSGGLLNVEGLLSD